MRAAILCFAFGVSLVAPQVAAQPKSAPPKAAGSSAPHKQGAPVPAPTTPSVAAPSSGASAAAMGSASPGKLILVDGFVADAKTRQQEGRAAFDRGDYAAASIQFEQAYAVSRDPRMLWNMALADKGQKRLTKAANVLTRFVKERGASLTPQERKDADELRRAIEAQLSKLQLTVSEADADVAVDDERVGATPITAPIVLEPGTHRIRVSKSGFKDALETESFTAGGTTRLEIALQADLHLGRLHIKAAPTDTLWVDGRVVGQGEWEGAVASGRHYVSVTAPGKRSYETETTVSDAEMRDLHVAPLTEAPSTDSATWLWVTGGVALAAGAIVGGYYLFKPGPPENSAMAGSFGSLQLPLGTR